MTHTSTRRRSYSPRSHEVATRPPSPNVEPYELRSYRVTVTANQWDLDEGRWDVIVRAFGPKDASNQALTDARAEGYPQARVLWVQLIEQPGQEPPESSPGATAPAPVGIDTDASTGTEPSQAAAVGSPPDPGQPAAAALSFDDILDSVWETAADAGRVDRESQDWGPLYALARETYPGRDVDSLDSTDWLAIRAIIAGDAPVGRPRGGA